MLSVEQDSMLQHNLFAYCLNNPVNRSDSNGEWSKLATVGIVVGATLCVAAITVLSCGVATATLAGAVAVGAAKGTLAGAAVGIAIGGGVGYATSGTLMGAATGVAVGFGAGAAVGAAVGGAVGGANYTSAANFLKNNGADVKNTLSAFKGTPRVKTLKADTTIYRTWGGASGKYGHWVSPKNYGSSARKLLALPPGNTTAYTSKFVLSRGTTVLSGKAASLFGQTGGGIQWWVSRIS